MARANFYYGHWAIEASDTCGHRARVFYPIRTDGGPCDTQQIRARMEKFIEARLAEGISCVVAFEDTAVAS